MKIIAIIEKGSDGLYSLRSDAKVGIHFFGGFGESVDVAKSDFLECVEQALAAEGRSMSEVSISYRYDVPSFFNEFDFFNVSKFASYAGINESKMRQYKAGIAYPSEKTMAKILSAAHRIGAELLSLSL